MSNGLEMKYFVLKPAGKGAYAAASRAAMLKYAEVIESENPEMAKDLRAWANNESEITRSEIRKALAELC